MSSADRFDPMHQHDYVELTLSTLTYRNFIGVIILAGFGLICSLLAYGRRIWTQIVAIFSRQRRPTLDRGEQLLMLPNVGVDPTTLASLRQFVIDKLVHFWGSLQLSVYKKGLSARANKPC